MPFKLKIISHDGIFFEGDVDSLNIETTSGYVTILPNHIPLVTPLNICRFTFISNKNSRVGAISGGLMYVDSNDVKILTNAIEYKEDIDIKRAEAALKRASDLLEHRNSKINVARAEAALKRALNRVNTYNR